jgi:hypothetical protein
MALRKLIFRPGINRDRTNYSEEGGWYACNKVRFVQNLPKKIGGWSKYTAAVFVGICRSLFAYIPTGSNNFLAVGTSKKVYVDTGGTLHDISPLRATTSAGDVTFAATNGSATITATDSSHGAAAGDFVTFSGAVSLGGLITAAVLNQNYEIATIVNSNSYTFTATATANSSDSGNGGSSVVGKYEISPGLDVTTEGYGWGVGTFGSSTFGTARATPIFLPLRLVHFTKYYDDLVFNIRYADIYYWTNDTGFTTRAVALDAKTSANEVPQEVTQVLTSQDNTSNILIALGCTPYPASGGLARDPLLIRWSDAANVVEWEPTDLNTAGSLQVQNGSQIIKGEPTYNETLIFTESTLNSMKYIGGFAVFRLDELSSDISVMGPNTVITVGSTTYWMGLNQFYLYNGRVQLLPCTLENHLFKNFNYDQRDQFFAAHNPEFNEIWWFYCSSATGSTVIDSYITYNYLDNLWFYGDTADNFDRTAWSASATRSHPQGASDDGFIYNHEKGNDADASALTAFITSAGISLDDGDKFALLRRVIPDVDFVGSDTTVTPSLTMQIETKKFPGSATATSNQAGTTLNQTVSASSSAVIDQYTEQVYLRARGRQLALTLESTGSGVAWQLGVPRADVRPDGSRG